MNMGNFSATVHGPKSENHGRAFGEKVSEAARSKHSDIESTTEMETETDTLTAPMVSVDQQIIETSFNSHASEKAMSILSREAVDHVIASLNEKIAAFHGKFEETVAPVDDIQTAYENGLDVSPEATADRIVKMSTAFFDKYRDQHSELTEEEAAKSFVELIGGGIDKGFGEAKEILSSLKVLKEGDIASNIDKTYDLVQTGLRSFLDGIPKAETSET
jgi:hypothetical protein